MKGDDVRSAWIGPAWLLVVSITALVALGGLTFFGSPWTEPLVLDGRWFAGALLGGAARLFAFRIHRRARIAVDSPIYISSQAGPIQALLTSSPFMA
ncbi:MAG: hypothetical protein AAFQ82_11090, partial [Myxococcota bacterium]